MRRYRLSSAAQSDIARLLVYTQDKFGTAVRERYQSLLVTALQDLAADPERIGSIARPELGKGLRSYHLRHSRERAAQEAGATIRKPRHLALYRQAPTNLIEIVRVLHDAMELERHLPPVAADD